MNTPNPIYTRFIPGENLITKGIYVYHCPTCRKTFRYDDCYEPICTGPSENRDDHPPEIMRRVKTDEKKTILGVGGLPTLFPEQRKPVEVSLVVPFDAVE